MATATKTPNLDATTEQFKDLNDRLVEAGRKAAKVSIDSYEKAIDDVVAFEKKFGEQSQVEFVTTFLDAHADLTHKLAKAYTSAARDAIA